MAARVGLLQGIARGIVKDPRLRRSMDRCGRLADQRHLALLPALERRDLQSGLRHRRAVALRVVAVLGDVRLAVLDSRKAVDRVIGPADRKRLAQIRRALVLLERDVAIAVVAKDGLRGFGWANPSVRSVIRFAASKSNRVSRPDASFEDTRLPLAS